MSSSEDESELHDLKIEKLRKDLFRQYAGMLKSPDIFKYFELEGTKS